MFERWLAGKRGGSPGPFGGGAPLTVRLGMALCLMLAMLPLAARAVLHEQPRVLVLHSYHQGFEWTDSIQKSFADRLAASFPKAEVFVEYMNTKRQTFDTIAPQLYELYRHSFSGIAFDAIVVSDNNALDFLLRYRDRLFPGVPVVFCGINDLTQYRFARSSGYTGVGEEVDIDSTISLGLKLHPGTRKVVLLSDATETSLINLGLARRVARRHPDVAFVETAGMDNEQLHAELGRLGDEAIVLDLGFFRDTTGKAYGARESIEFILSLVRRPVYMLWDFAMAPGVVGGKLVSGRLQGEIAATLVSRVLNGERPDDLPFVENPTAYTFDYAGLQRFDIDEASLPSGSIINGRPDTFYTRYKKALWLGTIVLALQAAFIVLLLSNISRRRREESARTQAVSALRDANEMFSLFLRHSPVYVSIKETVSGESRVVMVSDNFEELIGFSSTRMIGKTVDELLPSDFARQIDVLDRQVIASGEMLRAEVQLRGRSYSTIRFPFMQGDKTLVAGYLIDITERKEYERQLRHIAHYDTLTTLPNRVLLGDRLQQAMVQTARRAQLLAVVYLDLDGFKTINDRYGHETGDQLLVALAERMQQTLREGDTLARLGGDEFVAVLLDLRASADCEPMLQRLLAAAAQPVRLGELPLQVSASLGVSFYPQADEVDADQLLRQADQAMYQAKLAGRNRYHVFDAEQDRTARGHHESLEEIGRALRESEFVLFYQPKVNMLTGEVVGAEALIRWQHPQRGLLSPAVFLPVVENHPLAVDIGAWVIDSALRQIVAWKAQGMHVPVSVNVGARQLQQDDFVGKLRTALAAYPGLAPGDLAMEILETSALDDLARVSDIIESCRQLGVVFALDDFGTGYSSLTYLKRLSVSELKIDQSFVRDMLDDPDDLAILVGILGLARAFERQVVAEGVETIEQGAMLLKLGCELAQGYGIARPMPATEFAQWAAAWRPDSAWRGVQRVSHSEFSQLFASLERGAAEVASPTGT